MNKVSLIPTNDMLTLPLKAVYLRVLDAQSNQVTDATGFIVLEEEELFLYTCWHTVSGFEIYDTKVHKSPPDRKYLELNFQEKTILVNGYKYGGKKTIQIPLYEEKSGKRVPLWYQEKQHRPHPDINAINLKIPNRIDAIKYPLGKFLTPAEVGDWVYLRREHLSNYIPLPGEKLLIVGYPYGYSSRGINEPTPVVLTRFAAGMFSHEREGQFLLESPCAPAMSGSPVFVQTEENLVKVTGIYTGSLFPDHLQGSNEKTTALGTFNPLSIAWDRQPFVPATDIE